MAVLPRYFEQHRHSVRYRTNRSQHDLTVDVLIQQVPKSDGPLA